MGDDFTALDFLSAGSFHLLAKEAKRARKAKKKAEKRRLAATVVLRPQTEVTKSVEQPLAGWPVSLSWPTSPARAGQSVQERSVRLSH